MECQAPDGEKKTSCTTYECLPPSAIASLSGTTTTHKEATPCVCFADSPAPVSPSADAADGGNGARANHSQSMEILRKLVSEFVGTALLLIIVVGSGIAAENTSDDVGLQLLINSFATAGGLYGIITIFGPVSGAHFNPVVSMVDVLYGDMKVEQLLWYVVSQIAGAVAGTLFANLQFKESVTFSEKERFGYELWMSEVLATCTLIVVIHGCIRTGQKSSVPTVVAAWVAGGYFFTSSSIFANPAVTIGRTFTDTFAGIDPPSMGVYIVFQILGGLLGYAASRFLYPTRMPPATENDNLYRRVCILGLKEFVEKASY